MFVVRCNRSANWSMHCAVVGIAVVVGGARLSNIPVLKSKKYWSDDGIARLMCSDMPILVVASTSGFEIVAMVPHYRPGGRSGLACRSLQEMLLELIGRRSINAETFG